MDFKHKIALKGGFVFGLFFIIKNFILLFVGINNSFIVEILYKSLVLLGVGIFISYKLIGFIKKIEPQILSFKVIFSTIFLMWITAVFISFIFDFIFYNYLFVDFSLEVKAFSIEKIKEIGEKYGEFSNDKIKNDIIEIEQTNIYSFINILKGFVFSIPLIAVLCGLVSLIFKKN